MYYRLFQNYCLGMWMHSMQAQHVHGETLTAGAISTPLLHYLCSAAIVVCLILWKVVWSVRCTSRASQSIHDRLMHSVMLAPCGWFDATPIGRIINRFSKDISAVVRKESHFLLNAVHFVLLVFLPVTVQDSKVMIHMVFVFDGCVEVSQILVVISVCLPYLIVPFVPVVLYTAHVGARFLHISRELKRLESLKKSPVFVLFSETLQGLSTIRSFRQENRFFRLCCERLDELNRCHLYLWLANRWLNFRIQLLGAMVTGCVGLTVVLLAESIGSTVAGIVLIYSLALCDNILWLAKSHAECQMDMNSVDRVQEYSELQSEKYLTDLSLDEEDRVNGEVTGKSVSAGKGTRTSMNISSTTSSSGGAVATYQRLSSDVDLEQGGAQLVEMTEVSAKYQSRPWPSQGRVEFQNIYMTYKSAASPVLRYCSTSFISLSDLQ